MAKETIEKPGWTALPEGGRVPAGSAQEFKTGDWRSSRPVHDSAKCTHCLVCWIYCPDSSIRVEGGRFAGFDLDHCKGCGLCAAVCPPKAAAIRMLDERQALKEAK